MQRVASGKSASAQAAATSKRLETPKVETSRPHLEPAMLNTQEEEFVSERTYTAIIERCPDTGLYVGHVPSVLR